MATAAGGVAVTTPSVRDNLIGSTAFNLAALTMPAEVTLTYTAISIRACAVTAAAY
eukprot:COSAG06_NODE_59370_length_274_cov_0.868571_1_plen_55_part_10